jgi:SAM-dependent methyltransferase
MEEHYGDWVQGTESALFGKLPDAKVMAVAATLGDAKAAPVLDLGAGTGRNSLPLARAGHPTTALELVPGMVEEMRLVAAEEGLPVEAVVGDLFSGFAPRRAHYRLIVASELVSHFRNVEEVRYAYEKFADALVPGGLVLVNAFLPLEGYRPDATVQQISETASARIFDRADLTFMTEELPFELVSEESASGYERENLPPGGWPPTKWFPGWADGRNVFDLPPGRSPVELRWLLHRRR